VNAESPVYRKVDAGFGGRRLETQVKLCAGRLSHFVVLCRTEEQARAARRDTQAALESIKLQLEPHKTAVTNFDAGFDYLGVHFERDEYSYQWENKRITVEGDFPDFLFAYGPGYE
jgi:hypothetical protein